MLQDSVVTKTGNPKGLPAIVRPSVDQLLLGKFHACLIGVDADLIEIGERPAADGSGKGREIVMTLQSGGSIVQSGLRGRRVGKGPAAFRAGQPRRAHGPVSRRGEPRRGASIHSACTSPAPSAVRVLRPPPWLNRGRLGVALASTLAGMMLSGLWIFPPPRKNRRLRAEILEREKLTAELQQAKQQLSLRVDERTEELKLQISARKESEVRFKAVIGERTRLAQELHDGLQQGLTGVALQLDTASRLRERAPEQSNAPS